MHYITLDTNTWIYLANGTEPVRLLNYIDEEVNKGNITVLLPEIVIREWENNKDKTVRRGSLKHFDDINVSLNRILRLLGDKDEREVRNFLLDKKEDINYFEDFIESFNEKKQEVENAVSNNIQLIDDLFYTKSIIIPIKDSIYKKSGQFALEKKAPFKNKNSFADALILFSLLDYVKTESIEDAIFISYNTDDFCEKRDGKKFLHPDLIDEFTQAKSKFYKIVGVALNTIKKDIVTKEELALIEEFQNRDELNYKIEFCELCQENHDMPRELYFSDHELLDEREGITNKSNEIEVGNCEYCNSEHFRCVDCGHLNAVWEGEFDEPKECEACGLNYLILRKYDRDDVESIEYTIPKDTETCEKCGKEFDKGELTENLCSDCEANYSYGV